MIHGTTPKPSHLDRRYGVQFEDESVARAYHTRPPYPAELFDILERLMPHGPRVVLDLGCGTGDVALGLAARADRVDAVDPSEAMLRVARGRADADGRNVRWIAASAEAFEYDGPYSLVVAAESLHWMEWSGVMPRLAAALEPRACLALVSGRSLTGVRWSEPLQRLIPRYSTNQEYRPYDLVDELIRRDLFQEFGRRTTARRPFEQSIDDYVESFHTRNGCSRERMTAGAAAAFDAALRALLAGDCPDGVVRGDVSASVVWGAPRRSR